MWPHIALANLILLLGASCTTAVELSGYDFIVVGAGAGGSPWPATARCFSTRAMTRAPASTTRCRPTRPRRPRTRPWPGTSSCATTPTTRARPATPRRRTRRPTAASTRGSPRPPGARMLGILYPRAATFGGCSAHNALVTVYSHRSDFDRLARLTDDASWSADRMRPYFARLERNHYLLRPGRGHGSDGWLSTETAPLTLALADPKLLSHPRRRLCPLQPHRHPRQPRVGASRRRQRRLARPRPPRRLLPDAPLVARRPARGRARARRRRPRRHEPGRLQALPARHAHALPRHQGGSWTSRPAEPRAMGVEFLDGAYLYRASPRSRSAGPGVPGSATASREVIVAGGTYNSPQILKLSGIGPADELARLGIRVVKHLPGVGANLQDHYKVAVQGRLSADLPTFRGCTFGPHAADDPCLRRWEHPLPFIGSKGPYVSNGLPVSMLFRSSAASEYDTIVFGGPVNFRGYYPGYGVDITARKDFFTWAVLKSHPRNRAGSVTLQSADPLDVSRITYNYFDTGRGDAAADVRALREGVRLARDAFRRQLVPVAEVLPGAAVQSDDVDAYVRDTAWGHHASSTFPIGPDGDPMAVLDSSLRVRGVGGLRVVDAFVFPHIPGTFTAVILQQLERA